MKEIKRKTTSEAILDCTNKYGSYWQPAVEDKIKCLRDHAKIIIPYYDIVGYKQIQETANVICVSNTFQKYRKPARKFKK